MILAHVEVPNLGLVYFFVTHLSFVPTIQCRHVFELLRIIRSLDLDPYRPKIVVGEAKATFHHTDTHTHQQS